ncbi:DUF1552 domain-containing protein [Rubripirellula amarantea]|nr:DUF1552 domain-containing protein [Rubripirellula amarantea]
MNLSPQHNRFGAAPRHSVDRRRFLKAAGISLGLPMLDRWSTRAGADSPDESPHRLMFMCTTLGLHGPNFFPSQVGSDFELPTYLQPLTDHRNDFTVFSGLSHPDQAGNDGHASEKTFLTSARHPGLSGFQNTLSVDQYAAEQLGYVTRFPAINLSTDHGTQSYTRSGVMLPAIPSPSKMYAELFLAGSDQEIKRQIQNLKEGRSILDAVARDARKLAGSSSKADKARLAEYFQSVRDLEKKLEAAQQWVNRPKPSVDAKQPTDIENTADLIGRMTLMLDLVPLILQTDSTRVLTMSVQCRNDVPLVDGVDTDHHSLSHHGQDEAKIEQLKRVELAQMKAFGELIQKLSKKDESGQRLLDHTSIMLGSNLGNANSHDWRNLPILLAGGGYRHGQHIAYDKDNNRPLCDLFVTMLQRQGHETDSFGSGSSTIDVA